MDFKKNLAAFLVEDFQKSNETMGEESGHGNVSLHEDHVYGDKQRKTSINPSLQDYNRIMEVQGILLEDLIKPVIFLMKYFLPFHDVLRYDPVAKCIVSKKGSFIRKTFCIIWELLVLYRLGIKLVPSLSAETTPTSSDSDIVSRGAYFIFITYNITSFYMFWMKTDDICLIFNHLLELAEPLHLRQRSPPRIRVVLPLFEKFMVRYGVHATWIFVTFYVLFTVAIYFTQMFNSSFNAHLGHSDRLMYLNINETAKSIRYENFNVAEIHSGGDDYNIILKILSHLGSFMSIYCWMMTFLNLGVWALLFRQLILTFYWRIDAKHDLGHFIVLPEEIRTFNRIVCILEEYNRISGFVNLLGAIVVVTYVSTSIKHAFVDILNIFQIGGGIHLLLSYLPSFGTAFMAAEVQRVAGSFAGILKNEYGRWTKECGDPAESLCGIAIVHFDLSTSNIGLKGTGFYTVSYQFITTIVSVIITYSILVVQLFPQNSVEPG